MIEIIKPGSEYHNVKYIIINSEKNICKIIPRQQENNKDFLDDSFLEKIKDYNLKILSPISLYREIKLIWPQITREFNNKFSFARSWIARADLVLNKNILSISLESHMAYKKLNTSEVKIFFKNRLGYYLTEDIDIKFSNGNFLEEIKRETPVIKKSKPRNNSVNKDKQKSKDNDTEVIKGRKIAEEITHDIDEIKSEKNKVIIKGRIFDFDKIKTRNGNYLLIIAVTDKNDSITSKLFLKDNHSLNGSISEGDWVKIRGKVIHDSYSNELTIMINDINRTSPIVRKDEAEEKRVELHLHTQMSAMDSLVEVEKAIEQADKWGHPALAITDHGVVQSFPEAYELAQKKDIKLLYGLEGYMVDDGEPIVLRPENKKIKDNIFVIFDLETTGLNAQTEEIIEIGAVKLQDGKIIDNFSSFIKPNKDIPKKITEITGITEDMVKGSPGKEEVLTDFKDFIQDCVLVAHNADFDYSFLRNNFKKCDLLDKDYSLLDTLGLSRALLPDLKNHKLNTLTEHFKINLEDHHRALNDAEATGKLFLELIDECKKKDINNLKDINQLARDIDWRKLPLYHVIILALNKKGLKQIYKLVSSSHLDYFYKKPRILKSQLLQNRKNILIGSACEAGQLYKGVREDKPKQEIEEMVKFYDYLEIQPLGNNEFLVPEQVESEEELKNINQKIYKLGKKYNKPVVATCDVHFLNPENDVFRKILQSGQGYDDAENQPPLYFRTTEEMLEEFDYMGEATAREVVIENPKKIAEQIEEIQVIPDKLYTPTIEGADQEIREVAFNKAKSWYGTPLPDIVKNRLEKELNSIIENGYSVIYLTSRKLVKKSLEDGYLVGSRGSVGSSFAATMTNITEVNPLPPHYRCPECKYSEFVNNKDSVDIGIDLKDKDCPECGSKLVKDGFDIPFEVFLGFEGDKVPDIDLNFSGEYQDKVHRYTEKLFGKKRVFRAGTISTIADRTAFGFVKGYIDDNNLNLRKAEINRLVAGCTGVRRTTGQHPGGQIVVPQEKEIYDFTPIQKPANDMNTDTLTTHFDFHSIEENLLKLDILGHDDPTTLNMLQELTGVDPETIPLDDPETMKIFSGTEVLGVKPEEINSEVGTYGIPEFGTNFVRQMLVDTRPDTFADLVRISGLSHGTDVWLNNAQDLIKQGKNLSEVISVRDDIMNYLLDKGLEPQKAFWIMEHVRKGKGLTGEEEEAMREKNVPDWYIESCKTIKYMFPKAHAAAYVTMAFRIAYFKVHYPLEFYNTLFTIKANDFDSQIVSRGFDYICQKKEELDNKESKTAKDYSTITILEIVIEAILRGINFKQVDLYKSSPYSFELNREENALIPPLISLQGLGNSAAQKIAVSREEGDFSSIEDLVNRTSISKTVIEAMKEHGTLENLPESSQLSLF
ncbi:MAG: PolC-type DNA polymerase III [Bacillota bacterium]